MTYEGSYEYTRHHWMKEQKNANIRTYLRLQHLWYNNSVLQTWIWKIFFTIQVAFIF